MCAFQGPKLENVYAMSFGTFMPYLLRCFHSTTATTLRGRSLSEICRISATVRKRASRWVGSEAAVDDVIRIIRDSQRGYLKNDA